MKLIVFLLIVGAVSLVRGEDTMREEDCESVDHCDMCVNNRLECYQCDARETLLASRLGCIACPNDCSVCEDIGDEGDPNIRCTRCDPGFTLRQLDGTCEPCPDGCDHCDTAGVCHTCFSPNNAGKYFALHMDGTCHECAPSCMSCKAVDDMGTTECMSCISGYTLKLDKTCTDCEPYCIACSWNGARAVCSRCAEGYVLDSANNVCLSCPASCGSNCDGTQKNPTTSKCTSCIVGFYHDIDACFMCPMGCDTCTSGTECQTCSDGYVLEGDDCTPCNPPCKRCSRDDQSNNLVCQECNQYYGLVEVDLLCIVCEDPNCNSCMAGPAICDDCANGFYKNNDACSPCTDWHAECRACSESTCTSCTSSPTWINDGTGCLACSSYHPRCTGCDTTECTTCSTGYINDATLGCVDCRDTSKGGEAECTACTFAGTLVCTDCTANTHFLHTDDSCYPCDDLTNGMDNCATCTWDASGFDECTACGSGYYPNAASITECNACTTDCNKCLYVNNAGACTECILGHYLNPTSGCLPCSDTNNPGGVTGTSVGCDACSISSTTVTCSSCASGYYLHTDALCYECGDNSGDSSAVANCGTCTGSGAYSCSSCSTGYLRNVAVPTAPTACFAYSGRNCKYASSDNICGECDGGYFRANNGLCQSCPPNCASCNSMGTCTNCDNGYYLEDNDDCIQCSEHCATCSDSTGNCESCKRGYTKDDDNPTMCLACDGNCPLENCDYNAANNIVTCSACSLQWTRYQQNGRHDMCIPCPSGCDLCPVDAVTGDAKCTNCLSRHYTETGECGRCPSNCNKCSTVNGVLRCASNGCDEGYALYANNNQCIKCPTACESCTVNSIGVPLCSVCAEGFGLSSDKTSCLACNVATGLEHCSKCTDSNSTGIATCLECEWGYTFKDDHSECRTCSTLTNCDYCVDDPWECTYCADGYGTTEDKLCAYLCHSCQGRNDEACRTANFDANSTMYDACYDGACWVYRNKTADGSTVHARGCVNNTACAMGSKYYQEVCDNNECARCCVGNLCNDYTLTGYSAGANTISLGFGLFSAIILIVDQWI